MKARSWLVAAAVVLLPATAPAQGLTGRFTIAAQIGTQSEVAGDMVKSASGTLLDKSVSIDSLRYRDIYAPDLRLQALFGFGVGERTEVIARASYYETTGVEGIEAGEFDGRVLYMYFHEPEPYEELGFEVGLRYYLATRSRLKSYVAPIVGVRFQNEALVSFSIPEAGSSIQNVPFTKESTVPVFGLDIGFTFDLGDNFYIGMDTGIRYQTAPNGFDFLLSLTGIDDSEGRWSAPVVAMVGVRF
jgi:hypothetical protein